MPKCRPLWSKRSVLVFDFCMWLILAPRGRLAKAQGRDEHCCRLLGGSGYFFFSYSFSASLHEFAWIFCFILWNSLCRRQPNVSTHQGPHRVSFDSFWSHYRLLPGIFMHLCDSQNGFRQMFVTHTGAGWSFYARPWCLVWVSQRPISLLAGVFDARARSRLQSLSWTQGELPSWPKGAVNSTFRPLRRARLPADTVDICFCYFYWFCAILYLRPPGDHFCGACHAFLPRRRVSPKLYQQTKGYVNCILKFLAPHVECIISLLLLPPTQPE